ncbi:MAG: hypothetical protein MRY74_11175 [Neomegalonema sp.]|nr:hypothetical protein [Neomegalonema sp.]
MRVSLVAALVGCLIACGAVATAQSRDRYVSPSYYHVGKLPPNDTLSIRARPDAGSDKLGALKQGEGPIEVIRTVTIGSTKWAEIIFQEGNAFVAARFLRPAAPALIKPSTLPVGLVCGGTEPFWTLTLTSRKRAKFEALGQDFKGSYRISKVVVAAARSGYPAAFMLKAPASSAELTVSAGWCSDGMSDRDFGWRATMLFSTKPGQRTMFEGCCTLSRR